MSNDPIKYSPAAADFKAQDTGNQFAIQITPADPRADEWASGDIVVRLSIPYGRPETAGNTLLLPDKSARPKVEYRSPADSKDINTIDLLSNDSLPRPPETSVCWETDSSGISVDAGATMRIEVTRLSKMPDGTATVLVGIRRTTDDAFSEQSVAVIVPPDAGSGKPQLHYFVADKDYVLHENEEEVKLYFFTTGATAITLYKNNVRVWPPHGGSKNLFYLDKPGITSVYRLEARGGTGNANDDREKLLKDGNLVVGSLTVQVAQAGWNRQPLQQGYPTVLTKALDFTSGGSERLYGVFVDPATGAIGLYSSETGFPPWRMESKGEDFKEIQVVSGDLTFHLSDMSHSPGVASGGKLWLIGGSSVDPTKTSNEVWYYHKKSATNEGEWVRNNPGPFPARMGHCVVDFKSKLWVLGGSDGSNALNDVRSFDFRTNTWSGPATARWPARCMFAAVATPVVNGVTGFEKEKMWIYGGTKDPDIIVAMTDLWSTTDGVTWNQEKAFELGPLPGQPSGATLFWDDGLHLAGSFKAKTKAGASQDDADAGAATLSAMVYSLYPDRFLWEANPVSWGWEQFGGNTFLMQSIVFNRFWFFWSLFQDIQTPPKLNVFIPS
ncbi:MAG: hypothetical protein H7Z16_17420 [Pyrinomonadaceae bacterium]|nr:hypothetical protein [Pyrinomonadaceae bacterium]